MDRGAWQATVHWVAKSWTWLSITLDHRKSKRIPENLYLCFIDYAKEMGIPDHLASLLRNLNAGQEATVKIGHATTDWFKFLERKTLSYLVSLCLFNLYRVQFSHSVMSDSLQSHEPQHGRAPSPSPTPRVHPNPCPSSQWCHLTISSSVVPFSSCPQSFQHQGVFKWVRSLHQVTKVLELQLQHQSFQWTPRTDLL